MSGPTAANELGPAEPVDLCVIGAGPGGIAAAVAAADSGLRVTLVDRGRFPRGKVCGGCLNGRAIAALHRLRLSDTLERAVPTDRLRLGHRGRAAELPLPPGTAISRLAWDARLIAAARDRGVDVRTQTLAKLQPAGTRDRHRRIRLTSVADSPAASETLQASLVISADGLTQSATRSESSVRTRIRGGSRIGAGCLFEAADADDASFVPPGAIAMATSGEGYVGMVRVENGRLNVAAALDPDAVRGRTLAEATAAILQSAGWPVPDRWHAADWSGTPPLTRGTQSPAVWRVACVGDAAGYVEPFTGEGMAWALAAGEAAGQAAADWIGEPDRLESEWPPRFRRLVARRRLICRGVAAALRRPRLCGLLMPAAAPLVRLATARMNRV